MSTNCDKCNTIIPNLKLMTDVKNMVQICQVSVTVAGIKIKQNVRLQIT